MKSRSRSHVDLLPKFQGAAQKQQSVTSPHYCLSQCDLMCLAGLLHNLDNEVSAYIKMVTVHRLALLVVSTGDSSNYQATVNKASEIQYPYRGETKRTYLGAETGMNTSAFALLQIV